VNSNEWALAQKASDMNTSYIWVAYPILLDEVILNSLPVESIYLYELEDNPDEDRVVIVLDAVEFRLLIQKVDFTIVERIWVKPAYFVSFEEVDGYTFE